MSGDYQKELLSRLELLLLPAMNSRRWRRLQDCFGKSENIFSASVRDISVGANIPLELAQEIVSRRGQKAAEDQWRKAEKSGIKILADFSAEFPPGLKDLSDCPPLIYLRGKISADIFRRPAIALVGTRRASEYGRRLVRDFVRQLVDWQVLTVSGLARGIDTEVHQQTLNSAGITVAFVGCGLDIVYPPENKKLFQKISEYGAIISEFPLGTAPLRENFPRRNRLIAAASLATLVIEATADSGALITARVAAELGREVMAVPGNVYSVTSAGTNRLLKDGAHLVTRPEEIEEILPAVQKWLKENPSARRQETAGNPSLTPEQNDIINILRANPEGLSAAGICQQLKFPESQIFSALLQLELQGLILSRPGNVYILK
jgi:DNA processing protein